jgi:flagellum-specific peptidoglycan hydrolase FlgJ
MKTLLYIFCLLFVISSQLSWGQDTADQQKEQTTDTKNEENQKPDSIQEEPIVLKPQRLPSGTPRSYTPAGEKKSMDLLASQIPEKDLLWLEADTGKFLSLWQKDRSGIPKGALLIVHTDGEHANWPTSTKPLHDTLPDYGWSTLAISLPTYFGPKVPKRTFPVKTIPIKIEVTEENSENLEESEEANNESKITTDKKQNLSSSQPTNAQTQTTATNKENKPSLEEVTERRLEAALRFLHDRGQFNVILLGNGSGAIRAHNFLEKITPKITNPKLKATFEKPVRAIVIVNGHNNNDINKDDTPYDKWFSDPDIPVLDIFVDSNYRNSIEAQQRKVFAKQQKAKLYRQVRIAHLNQETKWGENQLSRRIRGFLDNHAVGIEIDKATVRRYR